MSSTRATAWRWFGNWGLGPREVALVWGDPPYGIRERTARAASGRGRNPSAPWASAKDWKPIAGDAESFDPTPWLAYRTVLWGANHYAARLLASSSWWVWDKTGAGQVKDHNGDAELAWTNLGGAVRVFSFLWKGMAQADKEGRNGVRLHPTMKPEALAEWGFARAKLKAGLSSGSWGGRTEARIPLAGGAPARAWRRSRPRAGRARLANPLGREGKR